MPRVPREFVPLNIHYLRDRAIQRAGPDAELLYIRALAHTKAGDSDGVVTEYDLAAFSVGLKNVRPRVAALVREHLWVENNDGWAIRSWGKWNSSQSEIAEEKARKKAASIKANHERWHVDGRTEKGCAMCFPVSNVRPLWGEK